MVGIACTHMAMGWIGGVLYSRVALTRSCFRGFEGRLVYVGRWTVTGACGPYNLGGSATVMG